MKKTPHGPRWTGWSVDPGPPPPPPEGTPAAGPDRREHALDMAVAAEVERGWRVESRSPTQAVLVSGHRPNHLLHAVLTAFTCFLWGVVWLVTALNSRETRIVLTVDEWGRVYSTRPTG